MDALTPDQKFLLNFVKQYIDTGQLARMTGYHYNTVRSVLAGERLLSRPMMLALYRAAMDYIDKMNATAIELRRRMKGMGIE